MKIATFAILAFVFLSDQAVGENWPRFRGPNGSGVSPTKLPVQWTEKHRRWALTLPGRGHSSPIIQGEKLFLTCGDDKTGKRMLFCFHAITGKELWKHTFAGEKSRKHRDNSFASSTPTSDANHVYVYWGGAKKCTVQAVTHEGKKVWEVDLPGFRSGHGFGPSLIVHDDVLIVPHDQGGRGSLIGLECKTGKEKWKTPRKGKASWSTPCVYRSKSGKDQIIFTNYEHGVTSIEPQSGKVLWEMKVFYQKHIESAIASPIVLDDLIFATCGWMGVNQEVIALSPPTKTTKGRTSYTLNRSAPLCVTPLVRGDLLFLWSDYGIVTCADVRSGKIHWKKRVGGSWYSSPVCANDALYNISRSGSLVVLSASKDFKLLNRTDLGEGSHSTAAIAHGRLYVRTFTKLFCLGERGTSAP